MIDKLRFRVFRSRALDLPSRKRWVSDLDGELTMIRDDGHRIASYSTSVSIRNIESLVEIEGNPSKYLQGHNLCGTDDLQSTIKKMVRKIEQQGYRCWLGNWFKYCELHEIHITQMVDMGTRQNKSDFMFHLCQLSRTRHRSGQVFSGESVYFGSNKSKLYYWRIYDKEKEVAKREEKTILTKADVSSAVRAELILKRAELLRLGLTDPRKWTPDVLREVFLRYLDRIKIAEGNVSAAPVPPPGMTPKDLGIWTRWQARHDLSAGVCRATVMNWRARFKRLYGIDLALPPYLSDTNILDFGWFRMKSKNHWMGYSDIFRRNGSGQNTERKVA